MSADVSLTARSLFPGADRAVYLDVASRGLLPDSAMVIAQDHIHQRVWGEADKAKYFESIETARGLFARLIGAHTHEVAITKNVSEGLNAIAASLDWRAGDEVLLCSALEHPNNIYPWRNLERRGVRVVDIVDANGAMPLEAMIARLSEKVRVVTLSSTTFRPGYRTDLERIGQACRSNGTLLVVDAAQSVGIIHLDLGRMPVDALVTSTQKGLCSLYGMGFLYVREAVAQSLQPACLARFSVDIEKAHEADYDGGPIRYRRGALRFDLGNYNFLAAEVTNYSLGILLAQGTVAIDAHVTALARELGNALRERDICVCTDPHAQLANIVCVDTEQSRLKLQSARVYGLLKSKNVRAALRGRYLRFSFHLYNNRQDVAVAADILGGCC